jgi:Zn-dependent protease
MLFTRRLTLFKLAGIAIRVDLTWLILATLITSSLALSWFPAAAPGFARSVYWLMGVLGAIGLFLSIVIHEFCHAIVGRHYKMSIQEISLFLFGGIAHLEDDPPTPKSELRMALAGPAASLALAAVFLGLFWLTQRTSALLPSLFSYLYSINVVVAIFNMIPGFPLDGGRVLRAILWSYKRDIKWATKIAAGLGQTVGFAILLIGVFQFFRGEIVGGIWSLFLGLLLSSFARASYVQLLVHQALHGKPAMSLMNPTPLVATPEMKLMDLLHGDFLRRDLYGAEETVVPVVTESRSGERDFVGCVDLKDTKRFPEKELERRSVADLMQTCSAEMRIDPDTDAETALTRMSQTGMRSLLVIKGNQLLGILSQRALVKYLTLTET